MVMAQMYQAGDSIGKREGGVISPDERRILSPQLSGRHEAPNKTAT
jgi:hypothetical protein